LLPTLLNASLGKQRQFQFLTGLNFVWVADSVSLGDGAVFVCVAIESLGYVGKVIARFDLVRLLISSRVGNLVMKIGVRRIRFLYLVPNTLQHHSRRNCAFHVEFISIEIYLLKSGAKIRKVVDL
jgi:hypothetical protein